MLPVLLLDEAVGQVLEGVILDLGAGSGAGAAMAALMHPEREVVAVDSRRKKMEFCRYAAARCGISNLETRWQRLSSHGQADLESACGIVMLRAVGALRPTAEVVRGLLRESGVVAVWSGRPGHPLPGWKAMVSVPWEHGVVTGYRPQQ